MKTILLYREAKWRSVKRVGLITQRSVGVETSLSNDEAPGSKPGFSMFLSFDLNEELIISFSLSYMSRHFGRVVKAAAC